jgi:conjugal transfer mating pair stabilization protein TraG
MSSHLQGSAMSVANDAAAASFSLGQTSFYNTSANNFSANKHDSNWSHMHGMHSEQLATGAIKTHTASGDTVFDTAPAMTKSAIALNTAKALSGSLNDAYEASQQTAANESTQYQTSLSNFAYRAIQLSQLQGHDLRLGSGVSESESSQYSQALSTLSNIAHDVANRLGVSQESALSQLTSAGMGWQVGASGGALGMLSKATLGVKANIDAHGRGERTSTEQDRYHQTIDSSITSREAADFNQALNDVKNFTQNHHCDESESQASHLSNQMGADLRQAQTASHNLEATLARASRISSAQHFVESHTNQVNTDMNQAFAQYVDTQVGHHKRDQLFSHPGDAQALHTLENLSDAFIAQKREDMIQQFKPTVDLKAMYQHQKDHLMQKENQLSSDYQSHERSIQQQHPSRDLSADSSQIASNIAHQISKNRGITNAGGTTIHTSKETMSTHAMNDIVLKKDQATDGVIPGHRVDHALEQLHIKKKENEE